MKYLFSLSFLFILFSCDNNKKKVLIEESELNNSSINTYYFNTGYSAAHGRMFIEVIDSADVRNLNVNIEGNFDSVYLSKKYSNKNDILLTEIDLYLNQYYLDSIVYPPNNFIYCQAYKVLKQDTTFYMEIESINTENKKADIVDSLRQIIKPYFNNVELLRPIRRVVPILIKN